MKRGDPCGQILRECDKVCDFRSCERLAFEPSMDGPAERVVAFRRSGRELFGDGQWQMRRKERKQPSFDVDRVLTIPDKWKTYRCVRTETEDRVRCPVGCDPLARQCR